ncbi:MAG TPA: acetylglutamate kinase [Phycisphaerales bacterium]|jgi:acetylglutamate kinase|nr:acetylglutamate kinase [Phycisphaerales bacterium]
MNSAIAKAAALIEAHRYIQRFKDKIVVVKVGGSIQEDDERMRALLTDVAFMSGVGIRPVLVHGGGKSITRAMDQAGIKARFIQGRRYTDRATLEIAERVLVNDCNRFLVENLNASGSRAIALHSLGSCVLLADRMTVPDPATGRPVDLGFVGTVSQVNTILLTALCEDGYIPVIAPVAMTRPSADPPPAADPDAIGKLNVNADTAAGHVAAALKAEKLVVLSDTHGIRTDPDRADSYASALTHAQIDAMIRSGVIGEGMLPKVEACLIALNAGVPKAHIIDGRIPHSLLLEIYTDEGIGTQITLG